MTTVTMHMFHKAQNVIIIYLFIAKNMKKELCQTSFVVMLLWCVCVCMWRVGLSHFKLMWRFTLSVFEILSQMAAMLVIRLHLWIAIMMQQNVTQWKCNTAIKVDLIHYCVAAKDSVWNMITWKHKYRWNISIISYCGCISACNKYGCIVVLCQDSFNWHHAPPVAHGIGTFCNSSRCVCMCGGGGDDDTWAFHLAVLEKWKRLYLLGCC